MSEIKTYLESVTELQRELIEDFRTIVLATDKRISESIKWGSICFEYQGNLCGFRVAKAHVTLLFFEGGLLNDTEHILSGTGPKARTIKHVSNGKLNKKSIQDLVKQAMKLNEG